MQIDKPQGFTRKSFPPLPQDWLSDGHRVHILIDVSEPPDLSPILEKYYSGNAAIIDASGALL